MVIIRILAKYKKNMPEKLPNRYHSFTKSTIFELLLFGYMAAKTENGSTVKGAAEQAQLYFGLNEDSCPLASMQVLYHKKQKQYINYAGDVNKTVRL